jgi:hypothetical protein
MNRSLSTTLLVIVLAGIICAGTIRESSAQVFAANPLTISSQGYGGAVAAVGDFNGDGILDLAVSNECPPSPGSQCGNGLVAILLGNGDGTFKPGNTYPAGGPFAYYIVAADFNRDGKLDLAVTAQGTGGSFGTLAVMLGNGDGTFGPATVYTAGDPIGAVLAVADLNGDGIPDLVIGLGSSYGNGTSIGVLLGAGDGTFGTPVYYPATNNGFGVGSIGVGDFNGDGKLDLAVSAWSQNSPVIAVLLGNGDGTLQPAVTYPLPGVNGGSVAVGDVNGDGKLDLVASNICLPKCTITSTTSIAVLLGNGDGTFSAASTFPSGSETGQSGNLVLHDFDGDGKLDVAISRSCANPTQQNGCLFLSGLVDVLLGNGDGTFGTPLSFPSGGYTCESVVSGDFNGDGKADLAAVNFGDFNQGVIGVLLNVYPVGFSPSRLAFGGQLVGASGNAQAVTLSNGMTTALGISSIAISGLNAGDFAQTNNCGTSLAAGGNCTINVTFTPTTVGTRSASILISDNAPGSPQTVALSGTGMDFSFGTASGGSTSATVSAGQTATYNLQVSPVSGFTGAVTLMCSGAPAQSTCTASPSSVNVSGTSAVPFTVTVSTAARSTASPGLTGRVWRGGPPSQTVLSALAMFTLFVGSMFWRARQSRLNWLPVFAVILLVTLAGCGGGGGGGNSGTPPGTYNLTVTGTQQGVNRTLGLTLTVN